MCTVAGKIVRLRQKLVDLADSVKGLFGAKKQQDNAVEKLERLKVSSSPACSQSCLLGSALSPLLLCCLLLFKPHRISSSTCSAYL